MMFGEILRKSLSDKPLGKEESLFIVSVDPSSSDMLRLFECATKVREKFFGKKVSLCQIVNIRSGNCPENCAFCTQSSASSAIIEKYEYTGDESIISAAEKAYKNKAAIGLVSSGRKVSKADIERIRPALKKLAGKGRIDASLGILDEETARNLKEAGITTYNHNLEAAGSFFKNIVTSHEYEERRSTVKNALLAGMRVCCGGIFGMGESWEQRIELASELRELGVHGIPVNFLNPVRGTPMQDVKIPPPAELLKIISLLRLMVPAADIKICGGRLTALGDLHSMVFQAGASGLMTGDYLTTSGRNADDDIRMINDLGLCIE